ncbi:hypothetical protein F4553_000300 [Allocatelliglobosispora scoriae]|uniref:Lsr2 family protein n=1 Tax=Allocatelliglobosispora scoriae TaxID=643052 RepID=A0A841BJ44_9ACTN|nr:Lsr2 family protein [Allocatelliglobosispora scoriae]MBB5866921.1 hypothetical protein [Allocatelliglobosispora scoriae]
MARHEIVVYKDDLDGTEEGVEVVKFGLDGLNYEVDLGPANQEQLRAALAPFIAVATKTGGPVTGRRPSHRIAAVSVRRAEASSEQRAFNSRVRTWATANGYAIKERGRVPEKVIEAYTKTGGK